MRPARRDVLLGAAALLAASLAGCTLDAPRRRLAMASGERGGTYLQFAELLRDVLASGGVVDLDVLVTGGSVDNLALLSVGDADLAIALADAVADAELVAIGRVYQNYLQCVVRADGSVTRLDDLAGRRVSSGALGSGAERTAARVLEAAGLASGPGAVVPMASSLPTAVDALRDGEIDAFFWSGGVPIPELRRLRASTRVTLVDLTPVLPALATTHPGAYTSTAVPGGVYDAEGPLPAIGVSNLLVARPDLSDAVAATLVDALLDDAERLVPEDSVGLQYLTASSLVDTAPIDLHPAARARYRERYG